MSDELNTTLSVHGYHPQHGALVSAAEVEKLMEPIIAETSSLKDSYLEQLNFSKTMWQRIKALHRELESLEKLNDKLSSSYGDNWFDGFKAAIEEQQKMQHGCITDYSDDDVIRASEYAETEYLKKIKPRMEDAK